MRDLFAAVFFVFFGLQTDPGDIPEVAVAAVTLAIVTGLTKVLVGSWAASRAGVGRQGRLRAGILLVARGEFSIVIAGLAVSANFEPEVAALAATLVLGTALLGPLATHFADDLARLLHQGRAATSSSDAEG
jgi:CPA2 family monovalent cation:H+ antiporter-2